MKFIVPYEFVSFLLSFSKLFIYISRDLHLFSTSFFFFLKVLARSFACIRYLSNTKTKL